MSSSTIWVIIAWMGGCCQVFGIVIDRKKEVW